jgi:hypothetical protein
MWMGDTVDADRGSDGVVEESGEVRTLEKRNKVKRNKEEKKKGHYGHFTLRRSEEAVLPNVFLKRLPLHHKSHSIEGARARAVLGGAGALPNIPLTLTVRWETSGSSMSPQIDTSSRPTRMRTHQLSSERERDIKRPEKAINKEGASEVMKSTAAPTLLLRSNQERAPGILVCIPSCGAGVAYAPAVSVAATK